MNLSCSRKPKNLLKGQTHTHTHTPHIYTHCTNTCTWTLYKCTHTSHVYIHITYMHTDIAMYNSLE